MRTLLLALFLFPLTAAHAQSDTEGVVFGFSFFGGATGVEVDLDGGRDFEVEASGAGVALRVGYGFTRAFTLYLEGGAAEFEDTDDGLFDPGVGYGELGGEFSFGAPAARWVPYVNVGLTAVTLTNDEDGDEELSLGGGGLKVGAGVNYFATPQLAIRAGLAVAGGPVEEIVVFGNDFDVDDTTFTLGRLHVGLSYRLR